MEETFPNIKEYHVFGYNTGGLTAFKLALAYPENIKGIMCLSMI